MILSMQLVIKLTEISKIFIDPYFLIYQLLKDISGIFMTKISTKYLAIVLMLGQDKLILCLAKSGEKLNALGANEVFCNNNFLILQKNFLEEHLWGTTVFNKWHYVFFRTKKNWLSRSTPPQRFSSKNSS